MVIGGVSGVNAQASPMGMPQANDPVAKNIQKQIEQAQKQLQELASNKDMSAEDKMKKRQELQQKISDLNNQLRQHQIEKRKEKQQEKTSSDDIFDPNSQQTDSKAKSGKQGMGLSQASMEAMISADTSVKQASVQGSVATKMEGKAGVLEIEIKLDSSRHGDVSRKQVELADVKQKAEEATASQLGTLAEANKTMQAATKADQTSKDAEEDENNGGAAGSEEETDGVKAKGGEENASVSENEAEASQQTIYYTPVDVRL